MTTLTPTLSAASQVQAMAGRTANEKLAFAMTGLSVLLLAKMTYDAFTHVERERLREIDRRSHEHEGARSR